jgi:uncharacterized RDD family membrane protein YckC
MTEQQFSQYESVNHSAEAAEDIWRNEVQDRLAHYQRRRGRRIAGAFTMRFPFPADDAVDPVKPINTATAIAEPTEFLRAEFDQLEVQEPQVEESTETNPAERAADPLIAPCDEASQANDDRVLEPPAAPEPEPAPFVDTIVRPRPKRKVIAFPKHLSVPPEQVYRLADPVTTEVPRILDVPEELQAIPTTPFLDGLQFESATAAAELRDHEHVDLPFRPARTSQRTLAAVVDLAVVSIGVAVFAAVAFKILGKPPLTKPLMLGIVAAAVVLWSVYEYLFLVHAGTTLGILATRMRIRTFQGKSPTLRQRRNRILGFYLSALSLGMGLMWAFVDVDELCWHDRLSRTYLSEPE